MSTAGLRIPERGAISQAQYDNSFGANHMARLRIQIVDSDLRTIERERILEMNLDPIMETVNRQRKQIISEFAGVTIDMDYLLCIPSVHATYKEKELTVDFGGHVRKMDKDFPQEIAEKIQKWVVIHRKEIQENHYRVNNPGRGRVLEIEPPI